MPRKSKTGGYTYKFAEGKMVFPDALDKPSRTIITGEGGPSPSRFKHVIKDNTICDILPLAWHINYVSLPVILEKLLINK